MHARMRQRVHFIHHKRRYAPSMRPPTTSGTRLALFSHTLSLGKMSTRKAKDGERGRHPVRHDITGVRKLCRSTQDISSQIPRSKLFFLRLSATPSVDSLSPPYPGNILCTEVLTSLLRLNRREEIISHARGVDTGLHRREVLAVEAAPAPLTNPHLLRLIIRQRKESITY